MGGGGEHVKAWLTGGYAPVLVLANAKADKAMKLDGYNAFQINGEVTLTLLKRRRVELGLLLGYKFNTVLGHGGGGGLGVLYDINPKLALQITGGLGVFPSARDRLDRDHAYPTDRDPAISPAIQGGANVGLVFFP